MRTALYLVAGMAALAIVPPTLVRSVLASTAATLIEATPFLLLGILLARIPALSQCVAYIGCGCTRGPSARSIPAAVAAGLLFGPFVAIARVLAATATAHLGRSAHHESHERSLSYELHALLPAAIIAAVALTLSASLQINRASPVWQIAIGALLGFFATPCALGSVAIAGGLHTTAPIAATAFLCIAGIADLRSLSRSHRHTERPSGLLDATFIALALLIVAARHGGELVNPRASIPLALTGIAALGIGIRNRGTGSRATLLAPTTMLLGVFISAPAPVYHATETTMTDLFAGEHLTFTGVLDHERRGDMLVRYAITCCRADAAPVAIRLSRPIAHAIEAWYSVSGTVVQRGDDLVLHPSLAQPVTPPTDPFIYR